MYGSSLSFSWVSEDMNVFGVIIFIFAWFFFLGLMIKLLLGK